MNLLLLSPEELDAQPVVLSDRRAQHLLKVLRVQVGSTLRAGVEGKGYCQAQVVAIKSAQVELQLEEVQLQAAPTLDMVLALPRPKAISRIVSAVSSFGLRSLTLINAWRVEKSYFASPRLEAERLLLDARLGCEQGRQCHLPEIRVENSFRRFVEDRDPELFPKDRPRFLFHPTASASFSQVLNYRTDPSDLVLQKDPGAVLAFGPEGGFIQQELDSWQTASYQLVSLPTGPLKTEVAIAVAFGQYLSLREPRLSI